MSVPTKVKITLAIIFGIGLGAGTLVFGVLLSSRMRDDHAGIIAAGCSLLAGCISAMIAHLAGGFRELDDRDA